MGSFEEARVKLINSQLNNLKSAAKNNTETKLRIIKKTFLKNYLPHESLLTTRQKSKIRNAFANNISTDVKLSKAIVQNNSIRRISWCFHVN